MLIRTCVCVCGRLGWDDVSSSGHAWTKWDTENWSYIQPNCNIIIIITITITITIITIIDTIDTITATAGRYWAHCQQAATGPSVVLDACKPRNAALSQFLKE